MESGAQHADERGIDLQDLVLGGNDADALLERFKELREAGLAAADGGVMSRARMVRPWTLSSRSMA